MTIPRLAAGALIGALALAACAGTDPAADSGTGAGGSGEATAMTFMAGYAPQANLPFVGAYVAEAKGYFADAGLDVTIEHSGAGGEHLQLLSAGEVDVTTQDAGVLLKRRADPGLPLVSLALLGQRGQQAFVALADSGMRTPADWSGRTVGYKGTPPPELFALMEEFGVDEDEVDLVNVGFDPRVLTDGSVDVYPVFKSNEPDLIRGLGFELVMWDPAEYGIPTLGLTYVATEAAIVADPDRFDAFVGAAMKGVLYAEEHPDEAVDIVLTHAGEDADAGHQRFMLDAELADFRSDVTEAHGPGWQTEEQWQALADELLRFGELTEQLEVTDAFTNDFVD